jgi:2-amino-4-hydroxy-6-hydroxymethyldihydropteridine diphosphokinase
MNNPGWNPDPERAAWIALGSNLGDSVELLRQAITRLRTLSDFPLRTASFWQSTPVDCPAGSPAFVNTAVELSPRADETPESLLLRLPSIEREFGRRPKEVLNEPRPLDLDLIAFASETRDGPELILPHPRAHLRRFVLQPLSEICPGLVLPGQPRTVSELLDGLPPDPLMSRVASERCR